MVIPPGERQTQPWPEAGPAPEAPFLAKKYARNGKMRRRGRRSWRKKTVDSQTWRRRRRRPGPTNRTKGRKDRRRRTITNLAIPDFLGAWCSPADLGGCPSTYLISSGNDPAAHPACARHASGTCPARVRHGSAGTRWDPAENPARVRHSPLAPAGTRWDPLTTRHVSGTFPPCVRHVAARTYTLGRLHTWRCKDRMSVRVKTLQNKNCTPGERTTLEWPHLDSSADREPCPRWERDEICGYGTMWYRNEDEHPFFPCSARQMNPFLSM
eukprot:gene25714-biopygen4523